MEKINYFLVLEKRLGDYNLIDINKLDISNGFVLSDITSLDSFTCAFTESEIKASIERSNMAHADYLDGTLKIVSDAKHKHNLRVLTKEIFNNIFEFQNGEEVLDQDYKNKLFGIYKKVVEHTFEDQDFIKRMLERFKDVLKTGNKRDVFSVIEELPYAKSRAIYFSVYDENKRRKEELLRKLEKTDDTL